MICFETKLTHSFVQYAYVAYMYKQIHAQNRTRYLIPNLNLD